MSKLYYVHETANKITTVDITARTQQAGKPKEVSDLLRFLNTHTPFETQQDAVDFVYKRIAHEIHALEHKLKELKTAKPEVVEWTR